MAEHGDYATNLALKLAGPLRRPPRQIADALVAALNAGPDDELLSRAEAARPGFVNVWLTPRYVESAIDEIRSRGTTYGASPWRTPRRSMSSSSRPTPPGR